MWHLPLQPVDGTAVKKRWAHVRKKRTRRIYFLKGRILYIDSEKSIWTLHLH